MKERRQKSAIELARKVLEDFEVLGRDPEVVLVHKNSSRSALKTNVLAALVASSGRLSSIDYAKKRYCKPASTSEQDHEETVRSKYVSAYATAQRHMETTMDKMKIEADSLPTPGVFGASLVLERLPWTLFSLHLLYLLGRRHEGHAVARLMLEQIAWANAAYTLTDINDVEKIVTTRTITELKRLVPEAGQLYGYLSSKTHIDYSSHHEFIEVHNEQNHILITNFDYYDFGRIVLHLADIFAIIWEISQSAYLTPECVRLEKGSYTVRRDRPFLKVLARHMKAIEEANKVLNRTPNSAG